MRLLLIDDETLARDFVSHAMPEGAILDYAQTMDEGLALVETQDYDLILTDLRIPGAPDGDALTQVLDLCPQANVLVITQFYFPSYGTSLIRQGATWITYKPPADIEPEVAERLLRDTILFTIARYESQQLQLLSLSANAAAIEELKREVRELRKQQVTYAGFEQLWRLDHDDLQALQHAMDLITAQRAGEAAEADLRRARETAKWHLWEKVTAGVLALIAALASAWAAKWWKP